MSKILSQNVCYVAYPRSAQVYGDAMDSNLGEPTWVNQKILSQNVCYVAYPRSIGDAKDSNLGEPGKDIYICLKLSQNVCYVAYPRSAQAHVDAMDFNLGEALRHTLMPWTPTWVNQEKISTFNVAYPIRHALMPRTPTWVNQEKISTFV